MPETPTLTIGSLTAAAFRPLLDDVFSLELGPGRVVEARLIQIREPARPPVFPGGRAPFSLVLRAPGVADPRQGSYVLGHPALGRFELFMTALVPEPEGAIFYVTFA